MPIEIINGPTIPAGEALSDAVDCTRGKIIKITMPGNWNQADLTFQTSSDGLMFNDIMRPDGLEVVCAIVPGTAIIGLELITGFVKFRSGTREHPVNQNELREFAIAVLKPPVIAANLAVEQKY